MRFVGGSAQSRQSYRMDEKVQPVIGEWYYSPEHGELYRVI